jgi:hypothetical protein
VPQDNVLYVCMYRIAASDNDVARCVHGVSRSILTASMRAASATPPHRAGFAALNAQCWDPTHQNQVHAAYYHATLCMFACSFVLTTSLCHRWESSWYERSVSGRSLECPVSIDRYDAWRVSSIAHPEVAAVVDRSKSATRNAVKYWLYYNNKIFGPWLHNNI